jgi:5-methylcytosine-specific restriction protein B
MAIPKNITKKHLLKAISKIDNEGIPKDGDSQYYDVVYNGKKYPPKIIVSYANIFSNGKELDRNSFSGGLETQCFKLLEENGFIIQKKSVSHYVLGASWHGNENGPDQSEKFIENGIWENGYDDKFLDVVNGVNIDDRVAIKSSFATRDGKSILRIKATGTVYENIGDGRSLKIKWDKRFQPFDLEGYGAYRRTIQKVSDEDIDAIFKSQTNMNYYPELVKFQAQAKTTELGTLEYKNNFQGLSVKVSFGKGNQARVPWIAFLNGTDNVQQGIYPVYLYYKDKNLLILAYGVSETHPSNRKWNISNEKTIEQFFAESNLGKPERYGSSYVFKSYDTNKPIDKDEINKDLNKLISIYKATGGNSKPTLNSFKNFNHENFYNATLEAGYFINEKLSTRFISSLLTKPFVILTGLSGSGKTKLAQAFAMWICENENQYCIVPVGADWTNREPLLGFPNALEKNGYVKPDNKVLDLIIEANKIENQNKPYFLILDEMNLSHVERYFADFLSVMESKSKIALHSGEGEWNNIPAQIGFPKNLFIIGTVNIDETTYMFSPKVLDRASVIEFRVAADEMKTYLDSNAEINLENLRALGKNMAGSFVELAKDTSLEGADEEGLNNTLMSFFVELKKTGAEFGYRSASEILRFAAVTNKLDAAWSSPEIADAAIMQKLLPKVHGSRRKLEPVLKTLGALCLQSGEKMEDYFSKSEIDFTDTTKIKYPVSLEKILRMYQSLISNGFTSYAEA